MIDNFIIGEIMSYVYGIDYVDDVRNISIKRLNSKLSNLGVDIKKVIYSTCYDSDSKSSWIVAAIKDYTDEEVQTLIEFILNNNMYHEYYIGDL